MKIFMIGGTGLLGSEGARELIRRGHEVLTISLPPLPQGAVLPPEMEVRWGNYMELSEEEIRSYMKGCEGFIFAAGIDERVEGKKPVYDMFYKYNIEPLKRLMVIAKEEGIKKTVILGSYFAYFERTWKELNMYKNHPYIRSRVDQERMALSFADNNMSVSVLELPYIFGSQPGRKPVWMFLVQEARRMKKTTIYPKGGSTMVTVRQVGQCIASALERGVGGKVYPVGYYNLTWEEMFNIVHKHMGLSHKKVKHIPKFIYKLTLKFVEKEHIKKGIEPGINMRGLAEIMTRNAFIDKRIIVDELGVESDNIDEAIGDSIKLCMDIMDNNSNVVDMKKN